MKGRILSAIATALLLVLFALPTGNTSEPRAHTVFLIRIDATGHFWWQTEGGKLPGLLPSESRLPGGLFSDVDVDSLRHFISGQLMRYQDIRVAANVHDDAHYECVNSLIDVIAEIEAAQDSAYARKMGISIESIPDEDRCFYLYHIGRWREADERVVEAAKDSLGVSFAANDTVPTNDRFATRHIAGYWEPRLHPYLRSQFIVMPDVDWSRARGPKGIQEPQPIYRHPVDMPWYDYLLPVYEQAWVKVLVSIEGDVKDVELYESSGSQDFDEKALSAIWKWRFEPAVFLGTKLERWALIEVKFP